MGSLDQPRDDHGRFSGGNAWAKKKAGGPAGHLATKVLGKAGGFSIRPGEPPPKTGYMVSLPTSAGVNHVIDLKSLGEHKSLADLHAAVKKGIADWLEKTGAKLAADENNHLGGWTQKDDAGNPVAIHLDISEHHADRDLAIKHGKERNQLSVWDVANKREIDTGGTGT